MTPEISWLDDPQVFRVNQLPAHSDHRIYQGDADLKAHQSKLTQSLDGTWQFKFARTPVSDQLGFTTQTLTIATLTQLRYLATLNWQGMVRLSTSTPLTRGKASSSAAQLML